MDPGRPEVEFEFTFETLLEFNVAVLKERRWIRMFRRGAMLLAALAFLAWVRTADSISYVPLILYLVAVYLFFAPWGMRKFTAMRYRRALRRGRKVGDFGRWKVTLDEAGLRAVTPSLTHEVRWTGIDEVVRAEDGVRIMTTGWSGYPIPRSAFKDAADFETFAAYALERTLAARGSKPNT